MWPKKYFKQFRFNQTVSRINKNIFTYNDLFFKKNIEFNNLLSNFWKFQFEISSYF